MANQNCVGRLSAQGDQAGAQEGQTGVEIPITGTSLIFGPEGIADPVVADFTATPVAANVSGEDRGWSWEATAEVVRNGVLIGTGGGRGVLLHDDQAADVGQLDFQGFEGEDFGAPGIDSSVAGVTTLAGKRGGWLAARAWARSKA